MEGAAPIERGEGMFVRGTRGLTLIVQPDNKQTE
jgi:hypothetical protein